MYYLYRIYLLLKFLLPCFNWIQHSGWRLWLLQSPHCHSYVATYIVARCTSNTHGTWENWGCFGYWVWLVLRAARPTCALIPVWRRVWWGVALCRDLSTVGHFVFYFLSALVAATCWTRSLCMQLIVIFSLICASFPGLPRLQFLQRYARQYQYNT